MGLKFARTRPPSCEVSSGSPIEPPENCQWILTELVSNYGEVLPSSESYLYWNTSLTDVGSEFEVRFSVDKSPTAKSTFEYDDEAVSLSKQSEFGELSIERSGLTFMAPDTAFDPDTPLVLFSELVGTSDSVMQTYNPGYMLLDEIRITGLNRITDATFDGETSTFWVTADGESGEGIYELSNVGVPTGTHFTIPNAQQYTGIEHYAGKLWIGHSESGHHYISGYSTAGEPLCSAIPLEPYVDGNDIAISSISGRYLTDLIDTNPILELDVIAGYDPDENEPIGSKLLRVTLDSETTRELASYTYSVDGKTVTFTNTSVPDGTHSWEFGDGTTSESYHATHTYDAGMYGATLSSVFNGQRTYYREVIEIADDAPPWSIEVLISDYEEPVSTLVTTDVWTTMLLDLSYYGDGEESAIYYGGDKSPPQGSKPFSDNTHSYAHLYNTSTFGDINLTRGASVLIPNGDGSQKWASFSKLIGTNTSVMQIFDEISDRVDPTQEIRISDLYDITDATYVSSTGHIWVTATSMLGSGIYELTTAGAMTSNEVLLDGNHTGITSDGEHLWLGYSESGVHYIRRVDTSGVDNGLVIPLDPHVYGNLVEISAMSWRDTNESDEAPIDGVDEIDILVTENGDSAPFTCRLIRVTLGSPVRDLASFTYTIDGQTLHLTNTSTPADPDNTDYQWFFGDGNNRLDNASNISYEYNNEGWYNVLLIMNSAGRVSTYRVVAQVGEGPRV